MRRLAGDWRLTVQLGGIGITGKRTSIETETNNCSLPRDVIKNMKEACVLHYCALIIATMFTSVMVECDARLTRERSG
jgi:hypothetical protein